jgi:hypothetical protein
MFTRRDRWQTAGIVFLVTCGGIMFVLFRAAQIAHVSFD